MQFAKFFPSLLALCASRPARAAQEPAAAPAVFFVGTSSGPILSVSLDKRTGALKQLSSTTDGGPKPIWQELSPANSSILYSSSTEAEDPSVGLLTSFAIGADGSLKKLSAITCLHSPMSLVLSPDGRTAFAAHYYTSAVSMFTTSPVTGEMKLVWERRYTLNGPGKVPARQDAPHPHQALFDPTGRFVVVPDLGADLLRIYSASGAELPSIAVPAGTGPRHGAFFPASTAHQAAKKEALSPYYYLVNELDNSLSVFDVTYTNSAIVLTPLQTVATVPAPSSSTGTGTGTGTNPLPPPTAAELVISPDGRFIYVSNRGNDGVFPDNGSGDGDNAISAFSRDADSGHIGLPRYIPSHVQTVRHFALDPTAAWLVVGGQDSGGVKAFPRDLRTGGVESSLGEYQPAAANSLDVPGTICITFSRRQRSKEP